jgi:hypothetical protein
MAFGELRIRSFHGGQIDFLESNLIEPHQAEVAKNCRIDAVGRLSPRGGQLNLTQSPLPGPIKGLHSYYYGDTLQYRRIIAVSNGALYYGDTSGVFTQLYTGLDVNAQVDFATCINYMVAFNGVNAPIKWDGNVANSPTVLANAPITGKYPVLHAQKLFVIVDYDTIRWSDSFQPESWPEVNYWDFDKGDGDKLTGMVINLGDLLIFKKYGVYKLAGTSLDDFRAEKVEKRHGAVCHRGIVSLDPYVYYIGEAGIFKWNGFKTTNLIEKTLPNLWKRVNQQYIHTSCAVVGTDGLLWFSLPIDGATSPNFVLALDPRFDSFWTWYGIEANSFVLFNDGSTVHLYSGHNDGHIVEQNIGHNDRGYAIESEWIGIDFDDGASDYIKKVKKAFVSDSIDLGEIQFSYRLERGPWVTPAVLTDEKNTRMFSISESFRYFQPRFYHNTLDQSFSIREFSAQYFRVKAK